MPLTKSLSEVADIFYNKFVDNQQAYGIHSVFYGDQDRLPGTPCVCLEPDIKAKSLNGAPRRVLVIMTLYVLIYFSAVGSPQDNRHDADAFAEDLEDLIEKDPYLLDDVGAKRVIHCYVTNNESGYVRKGSSIMRSSRLTISVESQAQLPS